MVNYLLVTLMLVLAISPLNGGKNNRPQPEKRTFTSLAIENAIDAAKKSIADPIISLLFENCFPNTLDTTVLYFKEDDTNGHDSFIITGDIKAMWLRDSTNQVLPYLDFVEKDPHLRNLIIGLINRQSRYILLDPYANAYNLDASGEQSDKSDRTTKIVNGTSVDATNPNVFERKFEIDSLAAVLRLATVYYSKTGDVTFITDKWLEAFEVILNVLEEQKAGTDEENEANRVPYTFMRNTYIPTDSLIHGRGERAKRCGMVKSAFRPSDDACTFPFFVPGNAMLYVTLKDSVAMLSSLKSSKEEQLSSLIRRASIISEEIMLGILTHGVIDYKGKKIFAYEVNGYGGSHVMDDANVPSLLSLPYIGFITEKDPFLNEIYQNTRKLLLSEANPFFFKGKSGEGIGGLHVGDDMIWPMSIIIRALTSQDDSEILECLQNLKETTADTFFMHESFNKNDPADFTRKWFAWANTLFGELIIKILQERPYLLSKIK